MKIFILLLTIFSCAFSQQYVFLVKEYDKEIELEAKIISNIALSSTSEKIKLFIPKITKQEQKIYSQYFNLANDCKSANFIFNNKGLLSDNCETEGKLFFTNNYKRLIKNSKYYGAFFWNKSRPNIVFIKQRLRENNVKLSAQYTKYIEDIDE